MNFYIIIPAHNEEDCYCSNSRVFSRPNDLPKQIVVVNDNSTDNTRTIVEDFQLNINCITVVNITHQTNTYQALKLLMPFTKVMKL